RETSRSVSPWSSPPNALGHCHLPGATVTEGGASPGRGRETPAGRFRQNSANSPYLLFMNASSPRHAVEGTIRARRGFRAAAFLLPSFLRLRRFGNTLFKIR